MPATPRHLQVALLRLNGDSEVSCARLESDPHEDEGFTFFAVDDGDAASNSSTSRQVRRRCEVQHVPSDMLLTWPILTVELASIQAICIS